MLALHYLGSGLSGAAGMNAAQSAVGQGLFAGAGIFFFLGARQYAHRSLMSGAAMGVGAAVLVWTVANALGVFPFPVAFLAFAIYSAVGVEFWVESRLQETLAEWLLSGVFFAWASLGLIFYFFQARLDSLHVALDPISALPATFAAMLMVMALYEEEKRRVERNMLALSNLNLAASSFAGGEIHRMLSQALDRVLGVVRLPAGAVFLHHGDPQGPTSVVAVGLNDQFCRAAQEEGLDDYLVNLVSNLGGLMGFRDLRDDDLMDFQTKDHTIRQFAPLAF